MTAGSAARKRSPLPAGLASPGVWVAVLGTALVLFTAAMVPLSLLSEQPFNGAVALVIGIPCAAVGVIVARSQPRNPLGWLLAAMGGCLILSTDGADYATLVYRLGDQLPLGPVAVVLNQLWGPAIFMFGLVILLFPDGRLTSAWWRWALRGYVAFLVFAAATLAVATAGAMIGHPIRIDANGGLTATDYPRGWFEIDRIISRTLAYAVVTGLLVGVYAGLVTLASVLVGSSALVVAIATLVVAALFNPLRRRVQRLVDRRFNRARYDADRTVAAFSARLQGAVDLHEVRGGLLDVVAGALEPATVSLWLSERAPA